MSTEYLRVQGQDFYLGSKKIILRGYGLGPLLNLEHFMIGIPGTDLQIRTAITKAYGEKRAARFWERFYQVLLDVKDFTFLKSLGVNSLRVSFNYRLFEDDQNPYQYKEDGFKQIDRILALCRRFKIFAILDLHAAPGGQNPDWHSDNALGESLLWEYADFRRRTIALWKHIARHYANDPWVAAYDLLNEPVLLVPDKDLLNRFYKEMIREIRTVDTNHILFIEGDMYAARFDMLDSFEDPNVACSFHFYPFLHQDISTKATQKERVEEELSIDVQLDDLLQRLKRPLWCGETGALFSRGDREKHESLLEDILDIYEARGISWSIWAYKDARSMGTLHPKADSSWMQFARQANHGWLFWDEFEARERYAEEALKRYSIEITRLEKLRIGFRYLASNQIILKEGYTSVFEELPFETLMGALDSFEFDRCETWEGIKQLVTKYTPSP
ncbi:MAG: cellulase family glycosylhydrolase [Anaerolineales bacterium]|nr:cellulase family glycosylhydrolase [Anaerolineales bacterium]